MTDQGVADTANVQAVQASEASSANVSAGAHARASSVSDSECAYCKFMRSSPCGAEFSRWEKCFDSAPAGRHERICRKLSAKLKRCVERHPDFDWQS